MHNEAVAIMGRVGAGTLVAAEFGPRWGSGFARRDRDARMGGPTPVVNRPRTDFADGLGGRSSKDLRARSGKAGDGPSPSAPSAYWERVVRGVARRRSKTS